MHGFDRVPPVTLSALWSFYTTSRRTMNDAGWKLFSTWIPASRFWRYVARTPHVRVLLTCADDARFLTLWHGVGAVDHHPVTLYSAEEVIAIRKSVDRDDVLRRYGLDPAKRHVGVFGFVSWYKGHLAAIKALEYLPEAWELSVVGGEHPRSIQPDRDIGNFLRQIFMFSRSVDFKITGAPATLAKYGWRGQAVRDVMHKSDFKHFLPHADLSKRVHFLGQPDDDELARIMVAFDYVVHPYIKTLSGQSGSGIASMALAFEKNALYSNAPVFRELALYFPGAVPMVNIGNYLELAQALQRCDNFVEGIACKRAEGLLKFNSKSLVAKYLAAIG